MTYTDIQQARNRVIARAKEQAIGPLLRKILCITGKHHYHLQEVDGSLGMYQIVICKHCGLGHKVNTSFR